MLKKVLFLCGALLLLGTASAFAFPAVDLTAGQDNVAGSTGQGEIWNSNITAPTGTGTYNPFLREQNNGTEEGFNTDFDPVPLDDKAGIWTHSVQFNTLATVTIGTTDYYSFYLDANEPNGPNDGTKSLISLDGLKIYKYDVSGAIATKAFLTANATLLYDMDGAGDQTVYIDTRLKQGSGTDDMTVYIPKSFFSSALGTDFMYFDATFGLADGVDPGFTTADGFEEWRALQGPNTPPPPPPIPEASTIMLFGSGLLGLVGKKFARKK